MKDIIREGHEALNKVAEEVQIPLSDEDRNTLFLMLEYIRNSQDEEIATKYQLRPSVGIAAPQINILKRMIAIYTTDEKNEVLYNLMLVNPKIISHSEEMTFLQQGEGCLSVDREVPGYVFRYKKITVQGYQLNENGDLLKVKLRLKGYVAIVVQHEIDHLHGILFTERIDKANPYKVSENLNPIIFE
ncbi:MAG: peptide deformylase [Haloplasmataceae bacterium]|jgi:peptide deformylase|nr:peptide deformylase [Haloplasmataceae bacterium]